MYRRPLIIAIYEPRWFMRVVRILNDRGIPYTFYYDRETLPVYGVLYTDHILFAKDLPVDKMIEVYYDPKHDCSILEKAILASMMKEEYNNVSIGIDPGRKPYMIILGDGEILYHGYMEYGEIAEILNNMLRCYPAKSRVVRVGGGSRGLELASNIKRGNPDIRVEIVDERETTPKNRRYLQEIIPHLDDMVKPFRNKDAYAALRIALRRGLEVV